MRVFAASLPIALVLVSCQGAVGGGGAAGSAGARGADGAQGLQGEQGPPGQPGADGAPGKDGTGDGTRLKVLRLSSDDGASLALPGAFFDSELGVQCSPRLAEDGITRCLPTGVPVDPFCSPSFHGFCQVDPANIPGGVWTEDTCTSDQVTADALFGDDSGCSVTPLQGPTYATIFLTSTDSCTPNVGSAVFQIDADVTDTFRSDTACGPLGGANSVPPMHLAHKVDASTFVAVNFAHD